MTKSNPRVESVTTGDKLLRRLLVDDLGCSKIEFENGFEDG
jgi:hypothetical protein